MDLPPARLGPSAPAQDPARRHEVLGLIALAIGLFVALALASFDARGGGDWCGPIGTSVAEVLVASIGTASVMVPWSLLVLAVRLFGRTVRPFRILHAAGTLGIIATIATALYLAFGERPMLAHLEAGGLVGNTTGEILRGFVGSAGAHLAVLTVLLIALVVRTRLSVVSFALSARDAGHLGTRAARTGWGTILRAWAQARDEDEHSQRSHTTIAGVADLEKQTAAALVGVFHEQAERARIAEPDEDDEAPGADRDWTPGDVQGDASDFASESDLLEEGASEPPADEEPHPRQAAESEESHATPTAATPTPEIAAATAAAADEAGEMQIVSHDEEIRAAMREPTAPVADETAGRKRVQAPTVDRVAAMPGTELLAPMPTVALSVDESQLRATADRLVRTLEDYSIAGVVREIHPGPVVTTYELAPAPGTTLSKIVRRADEIAMSLEALSVRIVAPIPGKGRVGFEIPNARRQMVSFRELMETPAFRAFGGALPVALGKDVVGAPYFLDLATMPHLIVAGSTGSGKSVGLNVMLTSLLYKRRPEEVRLLMIDPKQVELAVYDSIPHMLLPVVTDMKKAALALRWVVDEMERRYTLFAQTGSRNIVTYNERVARSLIDGKPLRGFVTPKHSDAAAAAPATPPTNLPYILVVVDEFADLMMVAGKEVEAAVARLAQKARAAGIHVILATQRPSVDVITGVIKANFPSRVAFKVSQRVDSRTILDQQGAEHLLGKGDMLILPPGSSDLRRVHCAYVSEDEVQAVTDHWRNQGTPTYDEEILRPREDSADGDGEESEIKVPMEKYEKAVALVLSSRRCSVSWVQRQLAVGYNVAARMVEKMERDGIVSAPTGPGKDREILG